MAVPPAFAPLRGQSKAVTLLTQAVQQQRIAPAYLLTGAPGIGRRLTARCFVEYLFAMEGELDAPAQQRLQARLAQGNHPDLLWIEPTYLQQNQLLTAAEAEAAGLKRKTPPQIRLEQIRAIARFVSRPPLEAKRSLIVIEQAERMAEAAANALLKTLEEPGKATLILIAPSPDGILSTLVSRCQRIPLAPLQPEDFAQVLQAAGQAEILQHPALVTLAQGSPGRAIALFQTLNEIPPDLLSRLESLPRSPKALLELAAEIAKNQSLEIQIWLLNYLQYQRWQPREPDSYRQLQLLETAQQQLLRHVQPLLVWEVTLLKLANWV